MIKTILLILVLLTGVLSAHFIEDYNGVVLINFGHTVIETNTKVLFLMLCAGLLTFLLIEWAVKKIYSLISGSSKWIGSWGARKKQQAFTQGLTYLAEGNYLAAQSSLKKIEKEDFTGLNILAAAEVEMQLGNNSKALELWNKAAAVKQTATAANIHIVKEHIASNNWPGALNTINSLETNTQNHASIVTLWTQALAKSGDWQTLQAKLPKWKKVLGKDYDYWLKLASRGKLAEIASKHGANELKQAWQQQSKAVRNDPAQQAAYIEQLLEQNMHQDAEKVLVDCQKRAPSALLLPLFKSLKLSQPTLAKKALESWIKKDEENTDLLNALAHLALNANNFALADRAASKSYQLSPDSESTLLMAKIKEAQQQHSEALAYYKKSVQ